MILDHHHYVRFCPEEKYHDGKASPEAFALRPERPHRGKLLPADTYLSGAWMEYRQCDLDLICADIPLTKKSGDWLLIFRVQDIRRVRGSMAGSHLDAKHEPLDPKDPDSHSGVHGYTLSDNNRVGLALRRLVKRAEHART